MQDRYYDIKVKDIHEILNSNDSQTDSALISQLEQFCTTLPNNPNDELTWVNLFVFCKLLLEYPSKYDTAYLECICIINEARGEHFFKCLEKLYETNKYNTHFFGLIIYNHNEYKRIFDYLTDKHCFITLDLVAASNYINEQFFQNFVPLLKNDAFVNSIQLLAQVNILNVLTCHYVVYNFTGGHKLRIDKCLQSEDSLKTLLLLDSRNLMTIDFFGYIIRNTEKCKTIRMHLLDENFCKVLRPFCAPDILPLGIDYFNNYGAIGRVIEFVIHYKESLLSIEKHLKDKTFCRIVALLSKAKCISKPILDWLVCLTSSEQGILYEALQMLHTTRRLNKDVLLLFYQFDECYENKNYYLSDDHINRLFIDTLWCIFYQHPALNILKRLVQAASTAETKDKFAKFQSSWNIYITDKQNGGTVESLNFLFRVLSSYKVFTLNRFNYILSTPSIKQYMPTIAYLLKFNESYGKVKEPQQVITALSYIAIILLLRDENPFDLSKAQELEKQRLNYQDILHKTYLLMTNGSMHNGADEYCLMFGRTFTRLNRDKFLSLSQLDTKDANISQRLALILTIAMIDYGLTYKYLTPAIRMAINKHPNPKQLLEDYKKTLFETKTTVDIFFKQLADYQEIRDRVQTLKQLRYERTSLFSYLPTDILKHLATFSMFGTPPGREIKQIVEENIQQPVPVGQIISVNSDVTPNTQTAPRKSVKAAAQ